MDQSELQRLLESPQGQRLLALLGRDGGTALRQAGAQVQAGNQEKAREILSPMLRDPEVRKLLETLGGAAGHG